MYHSSDGSIDRSAYWQDASEDVIRAAAINAFGEANKALSNGAEIRFGTKGGYLKIPDADFRHNGRPHDGTFMLGTAKASKPRDDGNGPAARALWAASVPTTGTPAETYLAARGILRHVPGDRVRFHPSGQDGLPCCIYVVTDREDAVVAIQRAALLPDGSDRDRQAGKKSLGAIRDGFFVLADPHPRQTVIVEGPEDALAIWYAVHEDISAPDARVVAMLGQRWAAAADAYPGAVFFADADSVDRAREAAASCDGWIADPSPHKDANAMLLAEGAAALWARVRGVVKAEPDAAPSGPKYPGFDFWTPLDFAAIPRLDFVYSDFYARGYTSLTVAPPKLGKSLLGLAEAVDIATGRGLLTGVERDRQRTFYYNAEDDADAIRSRVAALCAHYNIPQDELAGQLAVVSGVTWPELYLVSGDAGQPNETAFGHIEAEIERGGFDHVVFDPLQDMSRSPETNDVFRALGRRLREMATRLQVSVGIVHHTRKMAPGQDATMDDARGGGALRGTSRFNRLLVPMTESEAVQAGIEDHRYFFRVGETEANLAPPSSERNRWFKKLSVEIDNGAHIVAVERWQWPDAFEGVTVEMAGAVYDALGERDPPARESVQAKDWAGLVVTRICGFPITDRDDAKTTKAKRSRAKQLLDEWLRNGVLEHAEGRDANRILRSVLVPGPNDPRVVQT
jgi:hypothetical protein